MILAETDKEVSISLSCEDLDPAIAIAAEGCVDPYPSTLCCRMELLRLVNGVVSEPSTSPCSTHIRYRRQNVLYLFEII